MAIAMFFKRKLVIEAINHLTHSI